MTYVACKYIFFFKMSHFWLVATQDFPFGVLTDLKLTTDVGMHNRWWVKKPWFPRGYLHFLKCRGSKGGGVSGGGAEWDPKWWLTLDPCTKLRGSRGSGLLTLWKFFFSGNHTENFGTLKITLKIIMKEVFTEN